MHVIQKIGERVSLCFFKVESRRLGEGGCSRLRVPSKHACDLKSTDMDNSKSKRKLEVMVKMSKLSTCINIV